MIVDAILYVVGNGIKWRTLPADFPPWPTVYERFALWEKVGASQRLLDAWRDRVRLAEGRVAAPSAAVMDSQSLVWADGGYTGPLLDWARKTLRLVVEIVQRPQVPYFTVLPRRWVVERTSAWITGHRRCVRDYERLPHHHEAMVRWSMIRITSRRLAQRP